MKTDKKDTGAKHVWRTALLMVLLTLVAVTSATVAWFSIADNARVRSMKLDVTTGLSLRFDLDPHTNFESYVRTLTFDDIEKRISQEYGVNFDTDHFEPVTTDDCVTFTLKNGRVVPVEKGYYLEFTLHFMALNDCWVHLTTADSHDGDDGTSISSPTAGVSESTRISFTVDGNTLVYDPGMDPGTYSTEKLTYFGLPGSSSMVYTNSSRLFWLNANEDKTVQVHIWLEGTDDACNNSIKEAQYSIHLRFMGTDENNVLLTDET